MGDVAERKLWDEIHGRLRGRDPRNQPAEAPWYVVPADHKWFARLVVAAAMVEAMRRRSSSQYPKVEGKALKELQKARKALKAEK